MSVVKTHLLLEGEPIPHSQQIYNGKRKLTLTQGYYAWVDEEDFEKVAGFGWFASIHSESKNYVRAARMSKRRMIYLHHEILGIMPWDLNGKEIDHIDRQPLHCWKQNLRIVDHLTNMQNSARAVNRKGYCFNKRANSFFVYLDRPNHPRINLGYAKTEEYAQEMLRRAKEKYK